MATRSPGQALALARTHEGARRRLAFRLVRPKGHAAHLPRELAQLRICEVDGPPVRVNSRSKQNLRAQIVTQAGKEVLIHEQATDRTSREGARAHALAEQSRRCCVVEHVRAELRQEGVRHELPSAEEVDLGGAVEQCPVGRRFKREAQITSRFGFRALRHHVPDAVELVVTVDRAAIAEAGEQRLAPAAHRGHARRLERARALVHAGETAPHTFEGLIDEHPGETVCLAANLGTFRHGGGCLVRRTTGPRSHAGRIG